MSENLSVALIGAFISALATIIAAIITARWSAGKSARQSPIDTPPTQSYPNRIVPTRRRQEDSWRQEENNWRQEEKELKHAPMAQLKAIGCIALLFAPIAVSGMLMVLFVVLALIAGFGTSGQPSSPSSARQEPTKDSKEILTNDKTAEQNRKEEEAQKTKEQAAAKAKEEAEKAKEQAAAKAKIEAERFEVEMVLYELGAAEFYASHRVSVARQFLEDAKGDEKLVQKGRERLSGVIDLYPDTEAASGAKQILDGKSVPVRPFPPKPVIPKGITAEENEDALTKRPSPIKLPPDPTLPPIPISGMTKKPVYVRGYTRPDSVFVQPHYRTVSGKDKPG